MGACSSRPSVLEDEARVPPEPAPLPAADNAALGKEEIFKDTLKHDPEEIPAKESEEAEALMAVEKHMVEATPADDASSNLEVHNETDKTEVFAVEESNQVETSEGKELLEPVLNVTSVKSEEATQEGRATSEPETGSPAPPPSAESVAQESNAEAETEIEAKQESKEPGAKEGSAPALSESEETQDTSENPAPPPSAAENPFQSFMSNVTRGWGWR